MNIPGPVLLVVGPAAAALLTWLLSRWPRLAAAAGAVFAWILWIWVKVIPLSPTALEQSSRWFSGDSWRIFGMTLALTEGIRESFLWLTLGIAVLLVVAALFPRDDNLATAVLAMLAPLAVSLMVEATPIATLAVLMTVAALLLCLRTFQAASATAGIHWLALAALAAGILLAAEWMLVEAPAPLAGTGRVLLAAGGLMLMGGFPFHIWVAPLVEHLPPLAAAAVFGPVYLGIIAFIAPLFQAYIAGQPISTQPWLAWSGLITLLIAGLTAATAVTIERLLGGLVLLDAGMSVLALLLPGGQEAAGGLVQARFFGLLLAVLGWRLWQRRRGSEVAGRLAFLFGCLSLLGMPLTLGFDGRWRLLLAANQLYGSGLAAYVMLAGLLGGLLGTIRCFTNEQAAAQLLSE